MGKILKNAIVTFLVLALGTSTAFLAYLHFFASDGRKLSGEWTAEIDMTEQAAVRAFDWLRDIEGVSVSPEEVKSCMQGLTIRVNMTMEQTARFQGTFHCAVSPDSYDACNQAAYEALAGEFRELVGQRLRMAGYEGETDQDAVEALTVDTFGMSTVSYLMSCGPALLPSLEELQARYDGSGVYEAAEEMLIREVETAGTVIRKEERYIRKENGLILLEEAGASSSDLFFDQYPIVYTLQQ